MSIDEQRVSKAMAALDTMAALWLASWPARSGVRSMMALPDGEDRLIALLQQAYAEGLYIGRTSHDENPPLDAARAAIQPKEAQP